MLFRAGNRCSLQASIQVIVCLPDSAATTTSVLVVELGKDNFDMVIGRDMSVRSIEDEDMNLRCKVYEVVAPRIKRPTAICELTGLT